MALRHKADDYLTIADVNSEMADLKTRGGR